MLLHMDSTIHDIMVDLKIIVMLEPKGKLCLINGVLAVEQKNVLVPLKRYVNNTNRLQISHRIQQRIFDLETLFANGHIPSGWIKTEILSMIEPLTTGLRHLKGTYEHDSQLCANLDLYISRLNNLHDTYK